MIPSYHVNQALGSKPWNVLGTCNRSCLCRFANPKNDNSLLDRMRPGRKLSLLSTHYALIVAFLSVKAIHAEVILQEEASPSCYAGEIVGAGELGTQCETNMIMGTSKQEPGLAGISAYSQVRLNADEYPPAPGNLELEQVHVYVRHGTFPSCL